MEVLADETANPAFVAADLLSQAEHGVDSQAMLITTSSALQQAVKEEVERQLALLPRKEIAEKSLANSKLIVVRDMDEAIELTNFLCAGASHYRNGRIYVCCRTYS